MRNRSLLIVIILLSVLAAIGMTLSVIILPLPEPLAAILFTPTPTPTNTPTPTPTATPTPTLTPTPTPVPLSMTLILDPPEVGQGGTVVIELQANRAVTLTGSLADRTVNFVELNGSYWALSGFPSWSAVGPQTLVVEGRSALDEVVQVTDTLTITYTQFPTEIVDIPSDREFLLDPAIIWAERQRLAAIYAEFSPDKLWGGVLGYPLQDMAVTSVYGAIRQYDTGPGSHAGVDLDGELGDPVFAVADGLIALAESLQVRGNAVVLNHGLGVYSNYFHMSELAVQEGESVSKGQIIGRMGSSGLSTGAHLHWELRIDSIAVDPFEWTRRRILP
jgi:murein DD-endopeptidase MepM/ murein hydrolase activator NlpD